MILNGTTQRLRMVSVGATVTAKISGYYSDRDTSVDPATVADVPIGISVGAAATTDLAGATSSADIDRRFREIVYRNTTAASTFTVYAEYYDGSTAYKITATVSLAVDEALCYLDTKGWFVKDAAGAEKPPAAIAMTRSVLTSGTAATYTTPVGCRAIDVECWGAGGGGGGASNGASNSAYGSGGGAGAYCRKIISPPAATYTYTVGAKGTGGVSAANGTNGTSTTFGSLTAPAGAGGLFQATAATALLTLGGVGGVAATGGDFNGGGVAGGTSQRVNITIGVSGYGGETSLGGGGAARNTQGTGVAANANTGSGGGGAASVNAGGVATGGDGADGLIVVTQLF